MKKSILILSASALLLLNNCSSGIKGMMVSDIDATLQSIQDVRALPMAHSVGFEWKLITDPRVHGVNIYRGLAKDGSQTFEHIGSSINRYATHFVDTRVEPEEKYRYTFTTFTLGEESQHGSILEVQTKPFLQGVSFVSATQITQSVVKVLWAPHPDQSINRYIIERSDNGKSWRHVKTIKGHLSAEFIDTFISPRNQYRYRIIAKSYTGMKTKPSTITTVSL